MSKYTLADMYNGSFATFDTRAEAEAELDAIIAQYVEEEADKLMYLVQEDTWELTPAEDDYQYVKRLAKDPTNRELALELAEERCRAFHEIAEA